MILVYDGSFEGLLSAVFYVYERKINSSVICTVPEAGDIFRETVTIVTDEGKSARVWKKLTETAGKDASGFWKAWLSETPGIESVILQVIRYMLLSGREILEDYSDRWVMDYNKALKFTGREKHRMEAFVRFSLTRDGIFFAQIEPDCNVLPLLIPHFQSRYSDQKWLIWDLKRQYGIFYDLGKTELVEFEDQPAKEGWLSAEEEKYRELWKNYFQSVNIKERKNTKLHLRHIPRRYWKYLTEKWS